MRFSFLSQEYLQSCQELMEEALHFNITETPTSKLENGSSPGTPTDLQEIHFWQRHLQYRTVTELSRVCVCVCAAYRMCVNTVIKEMELLNLLTCVCSLCSVGSLVVFCCRNCESINCGFFSVKSATCRHLGLTCLSKNCICICSVNGIRAHRREKDILEEKANIANPTNPPAWTRLFCTCLRCLVSTNPRAKKCIQFLYTPRNALN